MLTFSILSNYLCKVYVRPVGLILCLQVMLVDSSLQLHPPVPVIPSPSAVLLLGTIMESPSGEWMGTMLSVPFCTAMLVTLRLSLILAGLVVISQLGLMLLVRLPSHQH